MLPLVDIVLSAFHSLHQLNLPYKLVRQALYSAGILGKYQQVLMNERLTKRRLTENSRSFYGRFPSDENSSKRTRVDETESHEDDSLSNAASFAPTYLKDRIASIAGSMPGFRSCTQLDVCCSLANWCEFQQVVS